VPILAIDDKKHRKILIKGDKIAFLKTYLAHIIIKNKGLISM